MPPYNPNGYQAPPPSGGQYDFFMEPPKPPRKSLMPNMGPMFKIGLIVGGIIALMVTIAVVGTIMSKSNDPAPVLTEIVQDQHEITRVSSQAVNQVQDTKLKNFAQSTVITGTSAQTEYVDFLKKQGVKVDTKNLPNLQDPRIDESLSAAQSAGTYDSTYRSVMQALIDEYQKNLRTASEGATTETGRAIFDKNYQSAQLMATQLNKQ